ncbi:unnamed protein product [Boreogadus saida]
MAYYREPVEVCSLLLALTRSRHVCALAQSRVREVGLTRVLASSHNAVASMNRDTEGKGIVLRELSCRTAAEIPTPELPDCCFGGSSAPGVHRRSRSDAAEASAAVRQLRRCTPGAELPPKLSGCSGGCPPGAEKSGGFAEFPPAEAARPLVHKIVAML